MGDPGREGGRRSGRRCVAGGCSNTKTPTNGISLHNFPLDRPSVLRQWTQFVRNTRKDWAGPTKYSVLCSRHFAEDCYPLKYRLMASFGTKILRRDLEKDAVPTISTRNQEHFTGTPDRTCGTIEDSPTMPSPISCSTPKKPRRAFLKREAERIIQDSFREVEQTVTTDEDFSFQPVTNTCVSFEEQSIQNNTNSMSQVTDTSSSVKETRSVGSQLSLSTLTSTRSHYTQTKWKSCDKEVQAVKPIKSREIGVTCNLLNAPPLGFISNTDQTSAANESFASDIDCTDSEMDHQEEVNEDSFRSDWSEESLESDIGNGDDRERKFLVYEKQLLELFSSCPLCAHPTFGEVVQLKGTFLSISQDCGFCRYRRTWSSQPFIGALPAGNFELSCALFSGSQPAKTIRLMQFLNMAAISYRTFMYHQQCYLHPAIIELWETRQEEYLKEVLESGHHLHLGGDGRADTPGHSAKFGSYTFMDLANNKVIDVQLVQSNEVGSSYHMEKEGLARGLRRLEEKQIPISHIVTDRHLQISKWLRENVPTIKHHIDVWHVAKGLKKKLLALGREKECGDLVDWIKSIINHLYWVPSSTPENFEQVRWEKWCSVINHIQNVHVGHGEHFRECEHEDLSTSDRQKRWLRPGTKVMEKLENIVDSQQMRKDIPMLSPTFQTSNLEAYHSVINHFAPKMSKFSYTGMQSRLTLAALHYNENAERKQATTRAGDLQYKIAFPKQKKGEYTVKRVKTHSTYGYVNAPIQKATTRASTSTMQQCEGAMFSPPPLCDEFFHPSKDVAVQQLHTRYRRN